MILGARSRAVLRMDIKTEGKRVDLLGQRQTRSHTLNLRDPKAGNPWYLLQKQSRRFAIKGWTNGAKTRTSTWRENFKE
jgi:hypothetical protein